MKTHELVLILPVGSANAISMRSLAEKLGITERTLRDRIRQARFEGYEIIGDMHGYYLPETQEDSRRFYNLFHKRALCSLASVSPSYAKVKEENENIPGQMSISDFISIEPCREELTDPETE